MKPSEIAKLLDVKPVTIRSWSDVFGPYLSPTGAGGDGAHRDFTDDDLRVLHYIKQQKDIGRHADDIKTSLLSMQDADELRDLPLPGARIEAEVAVVPAVMVDETRRALLREVATLESTIDELKAELTDERSGRRADIERLMRELAEMQANLSEYKTLVKLYEEGRLKPKAE